MDDLLCNCGHSINNHSAQFGECDYLRCGCTLKPSEIALSYVLPLKTAAETIAKATESDEDDIYLPLSGKAAQYIFDTASEALEKING